MTDPKRDPLQLTAEVSQQLNQNLNANVPKRYKKNDLTGAAENQSGNVGNEALPQYFNRARFLQSQ